MVSQNHIWIKSIQPQPSSGHRWAYTDWAPGHEYELHWPKRGKSNSSRPRPGDLMILFQRRLITHIVSVIDNETQETEDANYPWSRMVRVIGIVDPDNGLGVNTIDGLHLRGLQGGNCALLFPRCNRNEHAFSYVLACVTAHFALPLMEAANLEAVLYPEEGTYFEGAEKLVQHKLRERSPQLVRDAKRRFRLKHGRLLCEVCGFVFSEHYVNGEGFIEAHHLIPVSQMRPGQQVRVTDLAMVCSNCHRMLHVHPNVLGRNDIGGILC